MFIERKELFDKAKNALANVKSSQSQSKIKDEVNMRMIKDAQKSLRLAESQAFRNYERIAGEAEARAVQTLFMNPEKAGEIPLNYYNVPLNELIRYPESVPKVDADPVVKAILDFVARNPEFGKN